MAPRQAKTSAPAPRVVAAEGAVQLKKFRRGLPVGTSQAQVMTDAARWGQLATKVAVLRLISLIRNPAAEPALQKAAADSILDRFGFPKRNDMSFAGTVATGSPHDFQAAIDSAVAAFMLEREKFRVEATDATVLPTFSAPNGNGNGHAD